MFSIDSTVKNCSGFSLVGSLVVLSALVISLLFMAQQGVHSARLRVGLENRIEAVLIADTVLNMISTLPDQKLCTVANAAVPAAATKDTPGLEWLSGWEAPGKIRNIRVTFEAQQYLPTPTPTYTPTSYPSPCPSTLPNTAQSIALTLEYSRDGGQSWQTQSNHQKWIPEP